MLKLAEIIAATVLSEWANDVLPRLLGDPAR